MGTARLHHPKRHKGRQEEQQEVACHPPITTKHHHRNSSNNNSNHRIITMFQRMDLNPWYRQFHPILRQPRRLPVVFALLEPRDDFLAN
jgi:hypothetical protein